VASVALALAWGASGCGTSKAARAHAHGAVARAHNCGLPRAPGVGDQTYPQFYRAYPLLTPPRPGCVLHPKPAARVGLG
jgi:hypothetical protein